MEDLPIDKYEYKLLISLHEVEQQVNQQIRNYLHIPTEQWLPGMTWLAKNGLWYYTFGNGTLPYIEKKVVGKTIADAMHQNKRAWAFLATLHPKASALRDREVTKWLYLTLYNQNATQVEILENRLYLNETLLELLEKTDGKRTL